MLHNDDAFHAATEQKVGEVESRTDAEIIVVAASRSGSYRDVAILAGAAAAWVALGVLLFSPFSFAPTFIPFDLLIVGGLTTWIVNRTPALLRPLVSATRRSQQVARAAAAAFHEEAVHGTRGRTGVLVYVSAFEDEVVV